MAELGTPGTVLRVSVNAGGSPDVFLSMGGRFEHPNRVGPPERFRRDLGQPGTHFFTGNRVTDEDHATVEPGNTDTAVRNRRHIEFYFIADFEIHLSSLAHVREF